MVQKEVCVMSVKDPEDGAHWRINNWSESKNNLKCYCYNIVKECDQSTFEKQIAQNNWFEYNLSDDDIIIYC